MEYWEIYNTECCVLEYIGTEYSEKRGKTLTNYLSRKALERWLIKEVYLQRES